MARSSRGRTFGFQPKKRGSLPLRATKMLLSSNGRTPASQADVDVGSTPIKSTNF